jgi:hypothetical protein
MILQYLRDAGAKQASNRENTVLRLDLFILSQVVTTGYILKYLVVATFFKIDPWPSCIGLPLTASAQQIVLTLQPMLIEVAAACAEEFSHASSD